jgi:hypothetical protein
MHKTEMINVMDDGDPASKNVMTSVRGGGVPGGALAGRGQRRTALTRPLSPGYHHPIGRAARRVAARFPAHGPPCLSTPGNAP